MAAAMTCAHYGGEFERKFLYVYLSVNNVERVTRRVFLAPTDVGVEKREPRRTAMPPRNKNTRREAANARFRRDDSPWRTVVPPYCPTSHRTAFLICLHGPGWCQLETASDAPRQASTNNQPPTAMRNGGESKRVFGRRDQPDARASSLSGKSTFLSSLTCPEQ